MGRQACGLDGPGFEARSDESGQAGPFGPSTACKKCPVLESGPDQGFARPIKRGEATWLRMMRPKHAWLTDGWLGRAGFFQRALIGSRFRDLLEISCFGGGSWPESASSLSVGTRILQRLHVL